MSKHTTTPTSAARVFKYTGNISHIKAYIEANKIGRECMVEVFVRPLTTVERAIYGIPKEPKEAITGKAASRKTVLGGSYKMAPRPTKISRADLQKWLSRIQESRAEKSK